MRVTFSVRLFHSLLSADFNRRFRADPTGPPRLWTPLAATDGPDGLTLEPPQGDRIDNVGGPNNCGEVPGSEYQDGIN